MFVAIMVACSFAADRAEAQALYYRTVPIGERAIGLGGAFTGVANDPSAMYYNPAGITEGGRFQLLGSLASLVFNRRTVDDGFNSPVAEADFKSTGTTTLPRFIGTAIKFGRQRFGDHQFAIGFSTLEVARERFGVGLSELDPASTLDLRISSDYVMRWWGTSFAARVKENVSLGLSAYVSRQKTGYSEDIGLAVGGMLDDSGLRVGGDAVTSDTGVGVTGWDIVLRLGTLYRINPRWQLGFMFQLPGIPVGNNGSVFRRTTTTASGQEPTYFLFDEGGLSTRSPIPFELRTGFEFKVNALTILSVDAAVSGPVRARGIFERPEILEDLNGTLGVYFANSTERRWTPNAAVGAEHMFGRAVVAGGLFTNVSAAPDVPATTTEYTPDQVSMFGASVSVGIDAKGYRLTVGANGYFGRGDALALTIDRDAQVTSYHRTKATMSAVVLYIAGAISVASKGAKEVGVKYQKKKSEKENGHPTETEAGAGTDAGTDAGADTDADTGTDAGADTDADTGAGAGTDAGTGTGTDAGADADAGTP